MPVICTEQYVRGLGHTAPAVREALPPGAHIVEKTRFSALVEGVKSALRPHNRPTVLVCGVEAHVCVLQSVLGLLREGYEVFLLEDVLFSSEPHTGPAVRRMERAGAIPSTVKTLNYELRLSVAAPRAEQRFPELMPSLVLPEPEALPDWKPSR